MEHQKKKYFLLLATILIEKVPDASNAEKYYNFDLKKETHKIGKTIKSNHSAAINYGKRKQC